MLTETMIELRPVQSSRLSHAGYEPDTFTLGIRFMPTKKEPAGAVYYYENIGEEKADDFFHAKSLGTFFAEHILNNPDHPCRKIAEPEQVTDFTGDGTPVPVIESRPAPEIVEDEDDLKLQALEVSKQVRGLSIANAEEYAVAGQEYVRLREMRKAAQARVDRIKKPAYEAYKAALDLEKDVIGPYEQAENYLNDGMSAYRAKEKADRLRREAEENVRRRKEAEEDAKRKAKALAEEDAKAAEAQGQTEMAFQIREAPLPLTPVRVQAVVLHKDVPKIKGMVERAPVWRWRVKQGDEHLVPREYLKLDEVSLNTIVKRLKNMTNIPGIEVWEEEAKAGVRI